MSDYGLLGKTLSHSYSVEIHSRLGNKDYSLFEVAENDLPAFFDKNWKGINVTIPYKRSVIGFVNELSPEAKALGAVNCISKINGKTKGYNTDYFGFKYSVEKNGLSFKNAKVLVLGSGGASAVAQLLVKEQGGRPVVISRSGSDNYGNIEKHIDAEYIINATPVGMYPDICGSPLEIDGFKGLKAVVDMIYNPCRTRLMLDAEKRGIKTVSGLLMLVAQAAKAHEIFTGEKVSGEKIREIYEELAFEKRNIVLIGMPGCGKSQVGVRLAKEMGRDFIDLDKEAEKAAGKSIPEIFSEKGEGYFRQLETQVAYDFGKESGKVIACGGGVIKTPENYYALKANSKVIWLTRALYKLPTKGRPLSRQGELEKMWEERKPLYEKFADYTISNERGFGAVISAIKETVRK